MKRRYSYGRKPASAHAASRGKRREYVTRDELDFLNYVPDGASKTDAARRAAIWDDELRTNYPFQEHQPNDPPRCPLRKFRKKEIIAAASIWDDELQTNCEPTSRMRLDSTGKVVMESILETKAATILTPRLTPN
jgi:hypothetical protein